MDNKSRTYNSTRNMILGFASKLLSMILTFVGRAIFVRILAVEYLGINGLFADVLTLLSLADLGFGTAMAYSFYRPLAENNKEKIAALINFYKKLYNYIALIVAVVGVAIVPFLKYVVNVDKPIPNLEAYYLVMLANTVGSYLFIYKSSIIIADQKGHEISKYEMWINVIKLVLQSVVLYISHSYLFYIMITIVTTVTNNLIISRNANKMYPYIKEKVALAVSERKELLNNMKSVSLYKFSTVLITGTNNIIISILVGTASVGLFANYNTITTNLSSIVYIIFSSLTASLGNLVVKEGPEKRYEIFKSMQMVSFWLCGVFVAGTYFLVQDFISIWVGKDYLLSENELLVIALNFYLGIALQPLWSFREATGLYMKTKYVMMITALLNIILSIVLGTYFGLTGILAANFIAKISTYFWYEPKILFTEFFNRKASEYYISHALNFAMTFGAIAAVKLLIPGFTEKSIFTWILEAVICMAVVNLIYFVRYFKTREFRSVYFKMRSMLKPGSEGERYEKIS